MTKHILMRIFFWISFIIVALGFAGVVYYNINGGSIIKFMMYFTVQTNMLVVLYFAFYRTKIMEKLKSTITILISMTCIIYYAFIFQYASYINNAHFLVDMGLHFVNPVLMVTSNYIQKSRSSYFTNMYVMAYCFGYIAFAFTAGQVLYAFLDVNKLGLYFVITFIVVTAIVVNIYSLVVVKTNNYSYFKYKRRKQRNHKDFKANVKAVKSVDANIINNTRQAIENTADTDLVENTNMAIEK